MSDPPQYPDRQLALILQRAASASRGSGPSLYPELLSIIRRSARTVGDASELAGALEWRNAQWRRCPSARSPRSPGQGGRK